MIDCEGKCGMRRQFLVLVVYEKLNCVDSIIEQQRLLELQQLPRSQPKTTPSNAAETEIVSW